MDAANGMDAVNGIRTVSTHSFFLIDTFLLLIVIYSP